MHRHETCVSVTEREIHMPICFQSNLRNDLLLSTFWQAFPLSGSVLSLLPMHRSINNAHWFHLVRSAREMLALMKLDIEKYLAMMEDDQRPKADKIMSLEALWQAMDILSDRSLNLHPAQQVDMNGLNEFASEESCLIESKSIVSDLLDEAITASDTTSKYDKD